MTFTFEDYTLDTDNYVLRRGGEPIPLEPKIFDVLRFLVENRDRVVHKEELLEALWPGEFVTDSVLPRCIATARKALGDGGKKQTWIQTAHGRGYRFIGIASELVVGAKDEPQDTFVGRNLELEVLDMATREALGGVGRLVAIAGEPGIGKTRTADEAIRRARASGAMALEGRCYEGSGAPPFWPWVQALRNWLDASGVDAVTRALGRRASELYPLMPELAEHLGESAYPLSDVDPESGRFQLFDAIGHGFKSASRTRPLAIVLDDLHYADGPSLELLRFLAADLHRHAILIVCTYRDVELRRTHQLSRVLGELSREPCYQRVALRGLAIADVARILEAEAPECDASALSETVHDMTGGNAFFVGEVASLLRSGDVGVLANRLPEGIREAVGRRLDQLGAESNSVLRSAAAIGREFSLPVLARVSVLSRDSILSALDEAIELRLIENGKRGPDHYRFAHALVQQTLYEEIETPKRMRLHEQIGSALEFLHGDGDDAPLDEIAHHYYQAAAGGNTERAVHFARRAAERATQLFAFEESAAKYGQALDALALASDASVDSDARFKLLLAKGDQESRAGDRAASRETFHQALQRSRETENAEVFGRAALGFGGRGEMGLGGDGRTAEFIEEAVERLGETAPALRAQLLGRLGGAPPHTYSMSRRQALSEQSLALARASGDYGALTMALSARGWALMGPDHLDERLRVTDELLELASQPGGRDVGFLGYDPCFLAHEHRYLAYLTLGNMRAAARELSELEELALELRQPLYNWYVSFFRTSQAITIGDYDGAVKLLERAEREQQHAVHPTSPFVLAGLRLWIGAQRGEFEAVSDGLNLLYNNTLTLRNLAKCAEAMLLSLTGDPVDARRSYEIVAKEGFGSIEHDEAYLVQLGFLAELALEFDDRDRAAHLLELLRPYAHLNATIEVLRVCDGSVSAYAGQAATAIGEYDDAEAYFSKGLVFNEEMGCTSAMGSLRYHWASMLARRNQGGDLDRAKQLLGEADVILSEIGHLRRLRQVRVLRESL